MEKIQVVWEYAVLMLMAILLLLKDSKKLSVDRFIKKKFIKLSKNHYWVSGYIFISSAIYIVGVLIFSILMSIINKISIKNDIYSFYNS